MGDRAHDHDDPLDQRYERLMAALQRSQRDTMSLLRSVVPFVRMIVMIAPSCSVQHDGDI